ncbi:MAG TPA: anti-sigma factor [Kiloniellaceae bacterium]|nr:anti-sigma factor [Kiloniellaceae bacterium]
MAGPDDNKDLDAAERALGTEPRTRESAEERRARRAWDARLAPLALAAPLAEPPVNMFERIERGLDGEAETVKIIQLAERRARRWRAVAVGAGAVAACLAAWIAVAPLGRVAPPAATAQAYLALVTPEGGGGPAMIVEVRFDDVGAPTGTVIIQPLHVDAPEGRVLELWRIPPGQAPQSVGLVDPNQPTRLNVAAAPGDIMAITVEPPGGSPTGTPSGAPILTGPLVRTR